MIESHQPSVYLELPGDIHTMLSLLHPVASVLESLFNQVSLVLFY